MEWLTFQTKGNPFRIMLKQKLLFVLWDRFFFFFFLVRDFFSIFRCNLCGVCKWIHAHGTSSERCDVKISNLPPTRRQHTIIIIFRGLKNCPHHELLSPPPVLFWYVWFQISVTVVHLHDWVFRLKQIFSLAAFFRHWDFSYILTMVQPSATVRMWGEVVKAKQVSSITRWCSWKILRLTRVWRANWKGIYLVTLIWNFDWIWKLTVYFILLREKKMKIY